MKTPIDVNAVLDAMWRDRQSKELAICVEVDPLDQATMHDWEMIGHQSGGGQRLKCRRCGYSVLTVSGDDASFLDYAVPCDDVIVEAVMDA